MKGIFKRRPKIDRGEHPDADASAAYAPPRSPNPRPTTTLADRRRESETSASDVVPEDRRTSDASTLSVIDRIPSTLSKSGSNFAISPRLEARQTAPNPIINPLGLTLIYEPESPPPVDIIFVHGLGGTSRHTWSKGHSIDYFWPERYLPFEPETQFARLLSFGYDANFKASGPASVSGIADFAKSLLYSMKFAKGLALEELELGERPIIFIAHSMGGLVVKQAYILGQNDEKYSQIVASISAIMFLATPHRGSDLAEVLNRILTVSVFNSSKVYVQELGKGSLTIRQLNEQFQHIAPNLDIISFYETLPTTVGPKKIMVVEQSSATLGHSAEITAPLTADHHSVCKFDGNSDPNYIHVRNALQTLVYKIRSKSRGVVGTQGKVEIDQLKALLAVSETYQDDLEFFQNRWAAGTCEWILANSSYNEWMDGSDRTSMLWLHALPGSGKSILSSFVIRHLQKEAICVYHFFRFGDPSKRSLSTCLRTTAYQIAEQLPQFRQALNKLRSSTTTLEKTDANVIWDKVFVNILFKMRFPDPIYWVIDALDESDNPRHMVEMMQSISRSTTPIKVLLVSRHNQELMAAFERLKLSLDLAYLPIEDTKRDIRVCVEQEVEYMHVSEEFKAQIVERLIAGAEGSFLWVSLALPGIMVCDTEDDIDETLEGIPSGMEKMYQQMERNLISNLLPSKQKLGQTILTWVACSHRPLTTEELKQALQPENKIVTDMKVTISRVCGQFVVIDSSDQLVMVHQTARDHITTTDSALHVNITEGHEKLFAKCLAVLLDKHRRNHSQKDQSQAFLHYAMSSWGYHLNKTSSESAEPLRLLIEFLKGDSVLAWISMLATHTHMKALVSSSKSMNSYVQRKRAYHAMANPLLEPPQELNIVEAWATDFLKLLGKFGQNLGTNPDAIYKQIPPFCPKNSMVYRQFEQRNPQPHHLSVEGISRREWDDSLARLSLGPGSRAMSIVCSGSYIAVMEATGNVVVYDHETFEVKRTLQPGERIGAMSFSSCSTLFVTYGVKKTKVWCAKTGLILHEIPNPARSRAFSITFSSGVTELATGSSDRLIRIAKLTDKSPKWSVVNPDLLKDTTSFGRATTQSVPWAISFNADASQVAVAYRGHPLSIWNVDPPKLIRSYVPANDATGNGWPIVDKVLWHPGTDEVVGIAYGFSVFRWDPVTEARQEFLAKASVIASSPDGKFVATGDCNGTIKLIDFEQFTLVYQLFCEDMINDICFSPNGKRLYDLRGQFCNVWEPNALLRDEQASDIGSEAASTLAISEAVVELKDQISAIGEQFRGQYHAIGNQAGVVSVVDSLDTAHVPVELWTSPAMLCIGRLDWSRDGNYLACAELTGKVFVNGVEHTGSTWTYTPIFNTRLEMRPEGIQGFLLSDDGTFLFVKNGPIVTVWPLQQPSDSEIQKVSIDSSDTVWIKHPTDSALLIAFTTSTVQVYRWNDLSKVATFDIDDRVLFFPSPDAEKTFNLDTEKTFNLDTTAKVHRVLPAAQGCQFLMDLVFASPDGEYHRTILIDLPPTKKPPFIPVITEVPREIQQQIQILLGVMANRRLVFIDKNDWICSFALGSNVATKKPVKHYFFPKDWLNVECLQLCTLLADGRLLMPNNGELAVIRCTGI